MPNRKRYHKNAAPNIPDDQPDEVMALLGDIHQQNQHMMTKFDSLEANVTRRAQVAGAMAGAFTGGAAGTVVSVGIEFIKAKFGG